MLTFPKMDRSYYNRGKRFKTCKCGKVFVPDGRGRRVLCDDCRKEHKHVAWDKSNYRRQRF